MQKLERVGPHEWCFRWSREFYEESEAMDEFFDMAEAGDEAKAERGLRAILRRYPEHIDVMHHLAMILHHTGRYSEAMDLWIKAADIGRTAFPPRAFKRGQDLLDWGWLENRPFLRCLWGLMYHGYHQSLGQTEPALAIAREMLDYNPNDNQGVRALAMSWLLETGQDAEAVELAKRYPKDFLAETTYGRALALFRLKRLLEAEKKLKAAIQNLPAVADELLKSTHRAPRTVRSGYETVGGADQAYNYWEADGNLWTGTTGALDWLRQVREGMGAIRVGSPGRGETASTKGRAGQQSLPSEVREAAEQRLGIFCERRIPPHIQDQVRLDFGFRGRSATLYELRPPLLPETQGSIPESWIRIPVAQFRYDPKTRRWSLYCADRNSRWHPYGEYGGSTTSSPKLDVLLAEVDDDPTGIFWG